jgi:molybdate transport system substrate-binding protein
MAPTPLECTRRLRVFAIAHAFVAVVLVLAACDSELQKAAHRPPERSPCPDRPVQMAVAASLRDVAAGLVREFETEEPAVEILASFGASNALARQVELGAPIDLLVSADEEIVRSLGHEGLVEPDSIVEIARGRLVLAVPSGSPLERHGLDALLSPHLERLGLPSAAVPLGRYGRAWLDDQGLIDRLEGKILATENARANLAALDRGHVDLAILYASDIRRHPSLRVLHRPDPEAYPVIRYVAARVSRTPACVEIDRVLEAWQSSSMRAQLMEAGFEVATTTQRAPTTSDRE